MINTRPIFSIKGKINRKLLRHYSAGFTLLEVVITLVITGIVSAMIGVFLVRPVNSYFDTFRRASVTNDADLALRRMSREMRTALPNSFRQPTNQCIEFLPTVGGGRYRTVSTDVTENELDFSITDTAFDTLAYVGAAPSAAQHVVVYNLGIPGADAYDDAALATSPRGKIAAGSTTSLINLVGKQFPFTSPGSHFQVIPNYSVVYACIGVSISAGNGNGVLYRYTRAFPNTGGQSSGTLTALTTCPTSAPVGAAVVARHVGACVLKYNGAAAAKNGALFLLLQLTRPDTKGVAESIVFYEEVYASNQP
jgi:MSHA biogenesis protein MshO